jgi:hypothetical protein
MLTVVAFNVRTTDISTVVTSLSVFLNVSNNTEWVIKQHYLEKKLLERAKVGHGIIQLYRWLSVLYLEGTRVPGENHRPVASH